MTVKCSDVRGGVRAMLLKYMFSMFIVMPSVSAFASSVINLSCDFHNVTDGKVYTMTVKAEPSSNKISITLGGAEERIFGILDGDFVKIDNNRFYFGTKTLGENGQENDFIINRRTGQFKSLVGHQIRLMGTCDLATGGPKKF